MRRVLLGLVLSACSGGRPMAVLGTPPEGAQQIEIEKHTPQRSAVKSHRPRQQILALSNDTTCVVLKTGGVRCWGEDFEPATSDGKEPSLSFPGIVVNLPGPVVGIAAGSWNNCAHDTKRMFCWGMNFEPNESIEISGGIEQIAVANSHVCALNPAGEVYCFGSNEFGELGQGDGGVKAGPVRVVLLEKAIRISAAQRYACAVLRDGRIQCWGDNQFGQLGLNHADQIGTTMLPSKSGAIEGIKGAIELALTESVGCALVQFGELRCWGDNGDSSRAHSGSANVNAIEFDESLIDVSGGMGHFCGLTDGGNVYCWGLNFFGALGIGREGRGTDIGDDEQPGSVPPIDIGNPALRVSSGGNHNCVIFDDEALRCWGDDAKGQLGIVGEVFNDDGLLRPSELPVLTLEAIPEVIPHR